MICTRCSALNPDGAKFCFHCGLEITPPSWSLPPLNNQLAKTPGDPHLNWLADAPWWKVISVSLLAMLVIGLMMRGSDAPQSPSLLAISPTLSPTPMSSAERLAIAKRVVSGPYDAGNYQIAISHLSWIVTGDKEYTEALVLQQKLADEYRRQERMTSTLTTVFNNASPAGGSTADRVNRVGGPMASPEDPTILRERLRVGYELTISRAKPSHNFIKVQCVKSTGGYTLWATHTHFSQFSFDLRSFAGEVQSWISNNRSDLVKASVKRVGVRGDGPYGSSTWFDIKP